MAGITEYFGNAIPGPGYARGGVAVDGELLFSAEDYTQKGVTLKPGQGVLLQGSFIKQDAATKQYVKTTASDAEGVLRQTTDTGTTTDSQVWQANILLTGLVKLAAVSLANSGDTLTAFTGSRVNNVLGFFKF